MQHPSVAVEALSFRIMRNLESLFSNELQEHLKTESLDMHDHIFSAELKLACEALQ